LEKYEKIKKENDQTKRINWKWFDKMDRIFGCCENISPSFISNDSTGYISDEEKEVKVKNNSVESFS
jgi:hypothetical protein